MNREDLVWLAGLLEGEGSFDLHRAKYPRIRVGMTDRDVVGRAATLMGVSVRATLRPAPWSATFHAEVSGARAAELLDDLLPLMGARRSAKIATILGHYRVPKSSQRSLSGPALERPPALTPVPVSI